VSYRWSPDPTTAAAARSPLQYLKSGDTRIIEPTCQRRVALTLTCRKPPCEHVTR
jgi:hypothetical protein